MTAVNPSSETCQKGWGSLRKAGLTVRMPIPALLTRTSRPPHSPSISATALAIDAPSRTSMGSTRVSPGPLRNVATAARNRPSSRPVRATRAPASTSARAIASPRPLDAPVTRMRRPVTSHPVAAAAMATLL